MNLNASADFITPKDNSVCCLLE